MRASCPPTKATDNFSRLPTWPGRQGIVSYGLRLYVVGRESNSTFRKDVGHRILSGLHGYTTTPIAEIIGNGSTDTVAMKGIKEFLQDR